jgi:two-component system response regulator YesN
VSPAIRSCIQYINQHYSEHLTLDQVAAVAALSPAYLSGLFKAEVGQTFTEYVVQLRLERARQLLRQTDLPLADIAQMVGFDTQQYFNRVFKQKTGTTPLQYRNQRGG